MTKFTQIALLTFSVLLALRCKRVPQQEKQADATGRPNIIFLLTDDQRWDAMGAMGNLIIQTPNMDKLANAGVLFQNAYVTTSICCVSKHINRFIRI